MPQGRAEIRALAMRLAPPDRNGDFAQALMDLGATICRPKQPACAICPWHEPCAARAATDQESYPRKAAKREGKLRRGAAFVVIRTDGALLVRRREERGLLGGMLEVPGSDMVSRFRKRERPRQRAPSRLRTSVGMAAR